VFLIMKWSRAAEGAQVSAVGSDGSRMSKAVGFLIVLAVAASAPAAEPPTLRAVIDGMDARDARIFDYDVEYSIVTQHFDPFYADMKQFQQGGNQGIPVRIANYIETMDRIQTESIHWMSSGKSCFYQVYDGVGKDRRLTYEQWYDGHALGALNVITHSGGVSSPTSGGVSSCATVPLFLGLGYLELPAYLKQLDLSKTKVSFDKPTAGGENFVIDSVYVPLPNMPAFSITTRSQIEVDPSNDFWPSKIVGETIFKDARLGLTAVKLDSRMTVDRFTQSDGISYPARITAERFYQTTQFNYSRTWVPTLGKQELESRTTLMVDRLAINSGIPPKTFVYQFPPGSGIYDSIRRISYTVGDSPAKIDEALAEGAKAKAFYDALFAKPPPALEASQWLVGKPLSLDQIKNRPIILHFWNIGCGPCVAKIPQLQKQHGRTLSDDDGPLFISIHSYCDGDDLVRAKAFIKEMGITFPVILDAADPDGSSWGLTNKAYGIEKIPQDAVIDATGRLVSVGDYVRR
jgi:hypothetical protein